MKKKIFLCILVLFAILSIPMNIFANPVKSKISEYELLKQYRDISIEELVNSGLSEEEANEIKNIDIYVYDILRELDKLSEEELLNIGYNTKQIKGIKSINYNEVSQLSLENDNSFLEKAQVAGVFGAMDSSFDILDKIDKGRDMHLLFSYYWEWTSMPIVTSKDGFGIGVDKMFESDHIYEAK